MILSAPMHLIETEIDEKLINLDIIIIYITEYKQNSSKFRFNIFFSRFNMSKNQFFTLTVNIRFPDRPFGKNRRNGPFTDVFGMKIIPGQ